MNIDLYKSSMDEITTKKIEIDDLVKKNSRKLARKKYGKWISVVVVVCLLTFNLIPILELPGQVPDITIKVYAAEKETQLTKKFISFDIDGKQINGGTNSSHYFINYNLNLRCEGENIDTITYTCSDQIININNRLSAKAYYVDNISVPASDYSKYINEDDFIFGYKVEVEDTAKITKLIGNSYTVNYDNQNNRQYGLVLAGDINKDGKYEFNETVIKIDITLKDGSIQHKKIVLNPTNENSNSEFQMRIV